MMNNCPNCGADKTKGFISEKWGICCRYCGLGMSVEKKNSKKNIRSSFSLVMLLATAILIVTGMAYSIPGYPSAMFKTDRVAKIALEEQSKVFEGLKKLF
jgi:hypothetical protein